MARRRNYDRFSRFGKMRGPEMFGMADNGIAAGFHGPSLMLMGPVPTAGLGDVPDGMPAYFGQFEPWSQVVVFRVPQKVRIDPEAELKKGEEPEFFPAGIFLGRFCRITGDELGLDELTAGVPGVSPAANDVFEVASAMPAAMQMAGAAMQAQAQAMGMMQPGAMQPGMPQMPQMQPIVYRGRTGVCVAKVNSYDRMGFVTGSACRLWWQQANQGSL